MRKPKTPKAKKKTDIAALKSSFMRVPHLPVRVARNLLDAGYTELFQLAGRSPESLFAEIRKVDLAAEESDLLPALRLAVYFSENSDAPDRALLNLHAWQ